MTSISCIHFCASKKNMKGFPSSGAMPVRYTFFMDKDNVLYLPISSWIIQSVIPRLSVPIQETGIYIHNLLPPPFRGAEQSRINQMTHYHMSPCAAERQFVMTCRENHDP